MAARRARKEKSPASGEPAIVFESKRYPALVGQDILGLLLERGADIMFLCMGGSCGTCKVQVVAGAEHLEPADDGELEHFSGNPGAARLACQAYCRGTGDVVIEQG